MKRVLLTGANDGLGRAFGELCVKSGVEVLGWLDLPSNRNEEEIERAVEEVKETYSEFDAFINCAGTMSIGSIENITLKEAKDVFMINSIAPIYMTSKLKDVIINNKADILNVVSIMATLFDIELDSILYTSSKWGFKGASYNLEAEFSKTPCRVITLNPGGMNTSLFRKYDKKLEGMADEWMNPSDIADIMFYTLNLPKQVEVSEITISRKTHYQD